jgi:hypothetical protein
MVKQGRRDVGVKAVGWVSVIKNKEKGRTVSRQPNETGKKSLSLQNRRIFIEKLPSDSFFPY